MTIRKLFRIAGCATLAFAGCFLVLVIYVAWQNRLEQRAYENEESAGLSAMPPEVGFDLRSMWEQRSIIRSIAGFISSAGKGVAGAAVQAPSIPLRIQEVESARFNTEAYDSISDNPFVSPAIDPRATFSIDVDTASYANMRRFINQGERPPKDSVRIEEMINYFTYDYPPPSGQQPIAVFTEVASAPWEPNHRLVRIGIKARDIDMSKRPAGNLVFLIDVSGSMADPAKLPLLKSAMKLLIDELTEHDRIAIVVYAGSEGLVLPSTSGNQKAALSTAIDNLTPSGSTNGAAGIQLAYKTAAASFIKGGINRVVLATDGDFNVGMTNEGDLVRLIESEAKSGVFLSVLGFGIGNIKDSTLEKLADKGNGNYAYIDTLNEARKVFVEEMGSTLVTLAKDVKIQVEFNPAEVRAYRLIGYENRVMNHQDFNDDSKDAGDMGAGHTVTALFELVPPGVDFPLPSVDLLKYQPVSTPDRLASRGEMLNVKIRYKEPDGEASRLLEVPIIDGNARFNTATDDFRFAAAVASFAMILRDSPYKGQSSHLNPELEKRLNDLAVETGRATDELVEDAMAGYLDELSRVRHTLDRRYDDLKNGRAKPIDGEEAFARLQEKSRRRRDDSA